MDMVIPSQSVITEGAIDYLREEEYITIGSVMERAF